MENFFEKFINEEFEYIYSDFEIFNWFVANFNIEMNENEFYDNFDDFKNDVVDAVSNDEWIIQQIHERMDDMLLDVLKNYTKEKNQ